MVRRFFRDSAIYAGAGVFAQGVAFLMFPFLAHTLHPRAYGIIDIVGLLTTVALLTFALEINQGLGRFVSDVTDRDEWSAYASTALIWTVASYTILLVVGMAAARPLTNALLGADVDVSITRVALCGIWVAGALYLIQDQLRWQQRPKAFASVSAIVAIVTAGSIAIYVFALGGGALGVVAGQLTGAASGLVLALLLSRGIYRLRFTWDKARSMLSFSVPLVPSGIGVFLNGYADRLAIQHQTSLSAVGVYGIAFRIVVVVSLLLLGVQGATTPLVLSRHAEPETPRDLAQVFRLFWALGCVVFLVLSILAEPLVRLLSAQAYFGAARVVPYLVPAAFLAGLYVFAPGPIIAKRTRAFAGFNVGAGLLNLGLAFALVPGLGIVGAGVATAASSMLLFIALMILSQRLYPVPHNWLRIGSGAGAATVIVVLTRILLVSRWDEALGAGSLIARILISVLGSLVVLAILVDGRELRRLGGWTSQARGLRVRAPSPDSAQR